MQNCKMDTENNAMHMNPKHKWCMKKNFGQKHKNWKFFSCDQSRIDQTSIESGRLKPKFLSQFRLIEKRVQLIKSLEKSDFWKTKHFNAETPQSTLFYKKKMHDYEMKSFSKILEFNPNLPKSRFSIKLSPKRKH